MPANKALTTVQGMSRSLRPDSPRPKRSFDGSLVHRDAESADVLRDPAYVLLQHIAGWQFERNGNSLLFSLCYSFLQLSLGAMNSADRNAGFSRNGAHAQASRQQWRNFGPSV